MSQSLSQVYVHLIFHVKHPQLPIRPDDTHRLHAYMASILQLNDCRLMQIGGMPDHIHILCVLSRKITIAKLVEEIKRNSSRWLAQVHPYYERFYWQGGYGAFSVSPSVCNKTIEYIKNQAIHHKSTTFKEEYILFLKEYGIEYDEKYLW